MATIIQADDPIIGPYMTRARDASPVECRGTCTTGC